MSPKKDKALEISLPAVASELRYRKEQFEALFRNSGDAIVMLDEKHRVVEINQKFLELFGYTLEEIQGLNLDELLNACREGSADQGLTRRILTGEYVATEAVRYNRYGEPVDMAIQGVPILIDGKVIGGYAIYTDIRERRAAEKAVAQSREWYRTMVEDIPALFCRLSPDHTFTFANDAYCSFIGKTREEIVGMEAYNFIPLENHDLVRAMLESLTPEKPIATHEHTNQASDENYRWVRWTNRALFDGHGELSEYLSIGEDITAQKKAFEELKVSEAIMSSIVAALPDILFRYDRSGRCLDILAADHGKLYLPRERQLGKIVTEILPDPLAHALLYCINETLRTGVLQTLEFKLDTSRGPLQFETRCTACGEDEVIAIVRDITEAKRVEEDLRKSEEKYRLILENIEEGYYEVDLKGNITFCNDAACRMIGYPREVFLGMNYRQLYKDSDKVYQTFNRIYTSGRPDRGFTMEMVRKDGTSVFGELSISPIVNREGVVTGFRGVARDISERVRFEEQLKYLSLHDQLTGLYNRAFLEAELGRLSGGRQYPISIICADLDGLKLINDTMGHDAGDRMLTATAALLRQSLRGSDILARVGGDEFTVILPRTNESGAEKIARRIRQKVDHYNLHHNEMPLGLSLGVATARSAATALSDVYKQADNLMYQDKLYRSASTRSTIVQALLAALAERDFITEGHTHRVGELCRKMGEKIGLSSRQLSDLALLSQVHDLGKVGVPDHILLKEGLLTDQEWKLMRQHSEKGYRIAASSPDLAGVADLILKHHERWDGKGYPLGLTGEEIPIECRILAIADAFDAITSHRPYSAARSKEEAVLELQRCAGVQFDPRLVSLFLELL